ncbi:MAG: hypothetical protein ACQ9MH_13105 [Nitrospinales bacterium]
MDHQLPQLQAKQNDKIEIEIIFADNQLVIINNGVEVHATRSDRTGGRLNAKVNLMDSLVEGINYLSFIGIALGPRFQFNYNLSINDQIVETHSDNTGQCPANKGKSYLKSFIIKLDS